jgi:hypothetical protein
MNNKSAHQLPNVLPNLIGAKSHLYAFSISIFFALCAQFTLAQVNVPGSKEERETDAKALTAKTSEKPATPADRALVEAQLQALIDAYERGDVGFFQAKIDPSMPGYSRVLDSMRRDATAQARPRLLFTDQTWSIGPNVAMLQARFQKRYFDARNLNPELIEGRVVMLLSRDGDLWRVSAVTGDNPFESKSLAPCTTGLIRIVSPANANSEPLFVEVDDADLAGIPSIQADVLTDRGDREFITLTALNPNGLFRAQVNVRRLTQQSAAVPGNGTVDLIGDAVVTARYADQCVAVTRIQQVVTANDTRRDPGTLGQLACRVGGNTTFVSLATASANGPVNTPITIELFDPDLAGLPSIDVLLRSASGDIEMVTLGANGNLGRFLNTGVNARAGGNVVVAPRNGVLEIPAATSLSVEYLDQRSGVVGRTQNVNSECGGIPSGYQSAQVACSANTTLSDLSNFVTQPRAVPAQISVTDPDLALTNPAFINVTVRNSLGDSEIVRLDPQGAGRYGTNSLLMTFAAPTPGNGNLGFNQPGTISVDYTDATTASGSPQNVSDSCGSVTPGFTLATLTLAMPGVQQGTPNPFSTGNTSLNVACTLRVQDPDRTSATVNVSLVATTPPSRTIPAGGVDTETFTLPRVSAGVYERNLCPVEGFVAQPSNVAAIFQPVPNNNIINLGGGTVTVTMSYVDNTVPNGGSQTVSRTITVNN